MTEKEYNLAKAIKKQEVLIMKELNRITVDPEFEMPEEEYNKKKV